MKQKHIDASREVRLWVTQVLAPVGCIALLTANSPAVKDKLRAATDKVTSILKRK